MRFFFIAAALSIATFTSCDDKEDITIQDIPAKQTAPLSSLETVSHKKWTQEEAAEWSSWMRSPQTERTFSITNDFTVYGYSSKSSSKTRKVIISKDLALRMGIATQIYIMERITAKYALTIDGLSTRKVRFTPLDSPECGLYPDYTKDEIDLRGYSISQKGDKVEMATIMEHVISDTNGRTYDKWYPCKPEQLKWSYSTYTVE